MYSHLNSHWPYSSKKTSSSAWGYHPQEFAERLRNLEYKMEQLLKMSEQNNQLLRSIEEQQNRVCTNGGKRQRRISHCPNVRKTHLNKPKKGGSPPFFIALYSTFTDKI
ncbi:TolA-binding protein [Bacillus atrophaeus]|nr:TolA-binding protein [Bacillus atrophaeus]